MYAVSLLPSEYKESQISKKRNDRIIFIGLIACMASLVLTITVIAISAIFDGELKAVKSDNKAISMQIDELKPIEVLRDQISEMLTNVNQTAGLSPAWNTLISEIGNCVPPQTGLTDISASYKDQSGTITIRGVAASHEEVSIFIESLSAIDGLGEVLCKVSSGSSPDMTSNVQFEVQVQILAGAPYEIDLGGVQ